MELVRPKEITPSLLQEIVRLIVNVADPEKIIVFGSYAGGNTTPSSDLDVLVIIKASHIPRHERSIPISLALSHIIFPMDILVYTEEEVEEWSDVPQAFITSVVKKGRVIYEKDASRLDSVLG